MRLQSHYRAGRWMQALYHLEALAAREGWTSDRLRLAGDIWRQMGDPALAAAYWEAAANPGLARRLAEVYLDLQRWSDAAAALETLLQTAPNDVWGHYHLGLLRAAFDPTAAADHLRRAGAAPVAADLLAALTTAAPDDAPMAAGLTLAENDLWPYAELAFQHAANLQPPYPEALAYAGLSRDQQGKDGSKLIRQAAAAAPSSPVVRYLQGLHLRRVGDLAGSLEALQVAAALAPLNPAYAAEVGEAYRLLDDLGNAQIWLERAVTLAGADPRFRRLLDDFYASLPGN